MSRIFPVAFRENSPDLAGVVRECARGRVLDRFLKPRPVTPRLAGPLAGRQAGFFESRGIFRYD